MDFYLWRMNLQPDKKELIRLAHYRMPFGKYKGRYLVDLPEAYLVWFRQQGFPAGTLGQMLEAILEIKINELEGLSVKSKKIFPPMLLEFLGQFVHSYPVT